MFKKHQKIVDYIYNHITPSYTKYERELVKKMHAKVKFTKEGNYSVFFSILLAILFLRGGEVYDIPWLEEKDINHLKKMEKLLSFENNGDYKGFLKEIVGMSNEIFIPLVYLKLLILYKFRQYRKYIRNKKQYTQMLGYAYIPLLSYKGYSRIERYFHDLYFENHYKKFFKKIKHRHKPANLDKNGRLAFHVVNQINTILYDLGIFAITRGRLKSYFSVYNKMLRKDPKRIADYIGIRIIFPTEKDLHKFCMYFENKIQYEVKKDYITNPKPSWYKSLHYRFNYMHRDLENIIELQLRTKTMQENIDKNIYLSDFVYVLVQNKYDKKFVEIHDGIKEIIRLWKLKNNKQNK